MKGTKMTIVSDLIQRIADETAGGDTLAALELASMDSVNPGACTACGLVHVDYCEPDMRSGICEECGKPSVQSILSLAGII